ncbi:hypothetical protein JCM10207_002783 [Rhodosporidiobolus poonsookiae]
MAYPHPPHTNGTAHPVPPPVERSPPPPGPSQATLHGGNAPPATRPVTQQPLYTPYDSDPPYAYPPGPSILASQQATSWSGPPLPALPSFPGPGPPAQQSYDMPEQQAYLPRAPAQAQHFEPHPLPHIPSPSTFTSTLPNPFAAFPPLPSSPTKSTASHLSAAGGAPAPGGAVPFPPIPGPADLAERRRSRAGLPYMIPSTTSSGSGGATGSGGAAGGSGVGPIRTSSGSGSSARGVAGAAAAALREGGVGGVGGASGGTSGGVAATTAGAGGTMGAVAAGTSPAVAALAAGVGTRTTEKSCRNCRLRKVKCDRQWPRCNRCEQRDEECSFGTFVPVDVISPEALQTAIASTAAETGSATRVAELEARIQTLEAELNAARSPSSAPAPYAGGLLPVAPGLFSADSSISGQTAPFGATGGGGDFGASGSVSALARQHAFYPLEGLGSAFRPSGPPGSTPSEPYSVTAVRQLTLSDTLRSVFVAGAGMGPEGGIGQQTVETFLRGVMLAEPELYGTTPTLGGLPIGEGVGGLGLGAGAGAIQEDSVLGADVGEFSAEWGLARGAMGRALVVHLVQSFFASCCAYLPSFHGWHHRRPWILANIDTLDPASRVAVAAFCAMGARASPHSALLGIPLSSPSPSDSFAHASAAGIRREQACRALHTQAMDLVHLLGIALDATKENLEALMVMTQMLIFNELVPRRSRSMVHSALGHFKELQESALPPNVKDDLSHHIGLPLLTCDAITSAYARKKPLISDRDLEDYFPTFLRPDFRSQSIQTLLQDCLRQNVSPEGLLTHEGISRAAEVVHSWIAQCQRMFAQTAAPKPGGPPVSLLKEIKELWALLDEIHEGVRKLQEMLVHLSYVPHGCASDGCADQHLRFVTRLDKDLIDVFFLIHTLVSENLGLDSLVGPEGQQAFEESDRRIRKALKLVAFYSELYITSRDPHMTYHVVWQLEVLPNWTTIAVQRVGEPTGPATPDLEVSDTELDWFIRGLVSASFYHPVAISRLQELQQARRPTYPGFTPVPPAVPTHPAPSVHGPSDPDIPLAGSHDAPGYCHPTASHFFVLEDTGGAAAQEGTQQRQRVPAEDPSFTFQGGHTAPGANKDWGAWDVQDPDIR